MAGKEYKQFSCRETGEECYFLIRADTEEEVINLASDHLCRVHHIREMTPERKQTLIRSIWCDPQCKDIPGVEWGEFYWG